MSDFFKQISKRVANDPRVTQAVGEIIAEVLFQQLHAEHKGTKLYVPKTMNSSERVNRDIAMRLEFNGHNYAQLAKKFELTVRQTRRIIDSTLTKKV